MMREVSQYLESERNDNITWYNYISMDPNIDTLIEFRRVCDYLAIPDIEIDAT
jgi:hypothetical protein